MAVRSLLAMTTLLLLGIAFFLLGHCAYPVFIPSVSQVIRYIFSSDGAWSLLTGAWPTIWATFLGLVIGIAWAIPAGLTRGLNSPLGSATTTAVDFARSIPPSAMIPVAILFVGISRWMFVGLTAFATGLIVMVVTTDAIQRLPPHQASMMKSANWHLMKRITRLYLPSVLPSVAAASQVVVSLSLALVIVCEMLLATDGLGLMVRESQYALHPPKLYVALLSTGVVGVGLNSLLRLAIWFVEKTWYKPLRFPDE